MIRALVIVFCALIGSAAVAEAPLRPELRPVLEPALRPLARAPGVAKAMAPVAVHVSLAPQEARLDRLTAVPAPAPVVLVNLWPAGGPLFRPEGDFGGDIGGIDGLTASTLRPALRPILPVAPAEILLAAAIIRPLLRPGDLGPAVVADVAPTFEAALQVSAAPTPSAMAIAVALRPQDRSAEIVEQAEAARVARVRGSVCGNPQIQGEVLGRVEGSGACGIEDAVLVRSVDGVRLSTAATIDCNTANALQNWVNDVAKPVLADTGGGLAGLQIAGSYTCRPRNNQSGARLSEHGHGRAIDITGFSLQNGGDISVLNGWGSGSQGDRLRQLHRAACGIFGTVLGPEANRFHRDHFHFDTASYRSGSYCE